MNKMKTYRSNIVHTTRFWNNLHHVILKGKRLESQVILKSFRASRPKDLNSIANIYKDYLLWFDLRFNKLHNLGT